MTGSSMNTRVSANGYARSLQTLAGIGFVAYSLTKDGSLFVSFRVLHLSHLAFTNPLTLSP